MKNLADVENYSISHKLETKKKQQIKPCLGEHILTPFCQFWVQYSKSQSLQKFSDKFNIWKIGT